MVTLGNRRRGGGQPAYRKGWVAPAHTGDPPPREVCASDNGGPRPTKVKVRSDAVVASKQVYCACSDLYKRRKLRRLGLWIQDTG